MAKVIDGKKVQAAIDACYLWRGHVMKPEQVEPFLAKHGLYVDNEKIGMHGILAQDGSPFWIVTAVESPYGLEIADLNR
jgi:hypothetical protein